MARTLPTKLIQYGETRRGTVLSIERDEHDGQPYEILVFDADDGQGYLLMQVVSEFKKGQNGTITFTKGGPRKGHWVFSPDEREQP